MTDQQRGRVKSLNKAAVLAVAAVLVAGCGGGTVRAAGPDPHRAGMQGLAAFHERQR
jgi:predicted small secreted protein